MRIIILIGDHIGIGDPLKEEDIQVRMESHPIEEDIPIGMEGLLEEEDILEEDPLLVEDPLMMEDPLMVEGPLMEMEDPLDPPVDKDHQALKDPWASETYNCPNSSSNTGYLHFGENFQFSGTIYAAVGQGTVSN